ncbi:MAG: alcohol dehydrogenase catalytic domain-containing protein [Clostridia bacterium]|nr:alcohol dehydrogenase catalytic domain-containing protein [Clostridia bacterium]
MNNEMNVLFAEGYGKAHIGTLPIPDVGPDDVLVRVCWCGICGTDQDLFSSDCSFAENGQVTYPVRLGHEWSGVVETVGTDVTAFQKGDKVVGDNAVTCGECDACLKRDFEHCHHMRNVGTIDPVYDGAFAEYYVIPQHHLHKIPDGISLKAASLAEPFSVAYGGIKRMNITPDSTVAVIGTGCIGMAAVVLAKALGAKTVFMIGRNDEKLKVAETLGAVTLNSKKEDVKAVIDAQTNGEGVNFVLECSGAKETFKQAIDIAAFRATVALIGFYDNRENDVNVDTIVSKALFLFGVMGEMDMLSGALKVLDEHKPDLLPIITHELPFDDCLGGFVRKNYPNAIKIAVKIGDDYE